jgi:hypothetical protein
MSVVRSPKIIPPLELPTFCSVFITKNIIAPSEGKINHQAGNYGEEVKLMPKVHLFMRNSSVLCAMIKPLCSTF